MGPYYDHIVTITLGLEPNPPARPRVGSTGSGLRTARQVTALIWNWIKPRSGGFPMSHSHVPADWGLPRYERPEKFEFLSR